MTENEAREQLLQSVLESNATHYMFQLATGTGKTRCCIEKLAQLYPPRTKPNILVLVPRENLIDGWKAEFKKWKKQRLLKYVTIMCYASFKIKNIRQYDSLVLDEAHHTSERVQEILIKCKVNHLFVLSATIKKDTYWWFKNTYKGIKEFNVDIHKAIDSGILPEPIIITLPLELDNKIKHKAILNNPKHPIKPPITIDFKDRFKIKGYKGIVYMMCTEKQYSDYLDGIMDSAKRRQDATTLKIYGGKRLKFYASIKVPIIKRIMERLHNERTITFTGSVDNSIALGYPRTDSKIGKKKDALNDFNERKINHLLAVEKIDEGANLTDCKIGIFGIINTSTRMSIQRAGRIYRHPNPVLIFPYYKGTREEENINNLLNEYKSEYIKQAKSIYDIKI